MDKRKANKNEDIDDLIFNLAGAAIGFGIWKMKPVINLLRKYKLL